VGVPTPAGRLSATFGSRAAGDANVLYGVVLVAFRPSWRLNLIVTAIRMRAPGMTPSACRSLCGQRWRLRSSADSDATHRPIVPDGSFQRLFGMGFFDPGKGGNPILFQHLFWFYRTRRCTFRATWAGVISELLPVFAPSAVRYKWVALSSFGSLSSAFSVGAPHVHVRMRIPARAFHVQHLLVAIPTASVL